MKGQAAWPPFLFLPPTSPSLSRPCCALELGAGRFSVCPVAASPITGGIPGKPGPLACVYLKPGDFVWVGVSPSNYFSSLGHLLPPPESQLASQLIYFVSQKFPISS